MMILIRIVRFMFLTSQLIKRLMVGRISKISKKLRPTTSVRQRCHGVVVAAGGGIVTVSGLSDGAKVEFYSIDGKLIGAEKANSGTASIATSEHVVICKVGRKNIKILVK